jgi:hypothetical protein
VDVTPAVASMNSGVLNAAEFVPRESIAGIGSAGWWNSPRQRGDGERKKDRGCFASVQRGAASG